MIFVTSIISSQEWIRLRDAAQHFFSNEVLAREEIMRRFSLTVSRRLRQQRRQRERRRSASIRRPCV